MSQSVWRHAPRVPAALRSESGRAVLDRLLGCAVRALSHRQACNGRPSSTTSKGPV
ncbi:MAG: hypothetical protein ACRDOV_11225 [Streptomyces sp.]